MFSARRIWSALLSILAVLLFSTGAGAAGAGAASRAQENPCESFDSANFANPTNVDNRWFPLKPGTQHIYEGFTEEVSGERIAHRVLFTVTDLTKMIGGIRTVVIWELDYSDGQLAEEEIALFAQANDGTVWHFGQYPEVYEDGKVVETPAWIAGVQDARPGVTIKAEPQLGGPSYCQGWGPAVNWNDRAEVDQVGQETCVPAGCYKDVLVTREFSEDEPNAFQLKYYAPGVGNVRVGWKGDDATRETLELVSATQLSPEALADARAKVLALEKRAYENSKDVYGLTTPAEAPAEAAPAPAPAEAAPAPAPAEAAPAPAAAAPAPAEAAPAPAAAPAAAPASLPRTGSQPARQSLTMLLLALGGSLALAGWLIKRRVRIDRR